MRNDSHTVTAPTLRDAFHRELAAALDSHKHDPAELAALVSWIVDMTETELEPALQLRTAAIRRLRAEGFTLAELAELTGLSRARIDQIAKR